MKGVSSGSSLVTAWMLQKPKPEQPKTEHDKTEHSTTPSPTEVADSSQGAENPENGQTLSPTEVVDSTAIDYETWFMQHGACETDGNDDGSDDDFDDLATDEAAAIAEAMAEAAALNTTLNCHIGAKRQHEDDAQPEVPQQVRMRHGMHGKWSLAGPL
jgi:hypothetical protein